MRAILEWESCWGCSNKVWQVSLCKKESQVKSEKTAFSQEKSTKSQYFLTFPWLFVDFSWLKAIFFDFTWLSFSQRVSSVVPGASVVIVGFGTEGEIIEVYISEDEIHILHAFVDDVACTGVCCLESQVNTCVGNFKMGFIMPYISYKWHNLPRDYKNYKQGWIWP